MSDEYTIGTNRGIHCLVYYDTTGRRHRYSLGTSNADEAKRIAPSVWSELNRPKGITVDELWDVYVRDKAGRAVLQTMVHTRKAIAPRFGKMNGDAITIEDCRAHVKERRDAGIKDWTIFTEMGHLRMVLLWGEKRKLLAPGAASYIERPPQPRRQERRLTRDQVRALIDAADYHHVKLYIVVIYGTAARTAALLDLIWSRVDFETGLIDLRNPEITTPHKGRAIVKMTPMVRKHLLEAREGSLSKYVIEWVGKKVKSCKRGLKTAAKKAGLGRVNPHLLRHSAATHMAEAGVPMEEIQQYLGHEDIEVTRLLYARFSPEHLAKGAAALDFQ